MSQKPYQREQGDFELRILKDGRLVMIAPDETLLEIAQAIEVTGAGDEAPEAGDEGIAPRPAAPRSRPLVKADSEPQHLESHNAETAAPGRE
jgi:hypothetical protein